MYTKLIAPFITLFLSIGAVFFLYQNDTNASFTASNCTYIAIDQAAQTIQWLDCTTWSGATAPQYTNRTGTGTWYNIAYQDNDGSYYLNMDFAPMRDYWFYTIILTVFGVYIFIKFIRFLKALFF